MGNMTPQGADATGKTLANAAFLAAFLFGLAAVIAAARWW